MMRNLLRPQSLLWPLLLAGVVALFYVLASPGRLHADAFEYDVLAHNILEGRYELVGEFNGISEPTMHREPGYPLFRALIYAIPGAGLQTILFVQVALILLTVFIAARAVGRLDPRWELPVAWLGAIHPGLTVYASQSYAEPLAAFFMATIGYLWVRIWEVRRTDAWWKWVVGLGLVMGLAMLTRATYQFLAIFAAMWLILAWHNRRALIAAMLLIVLSTAVALPWIIRNGTQFGAYQITYRTGIVLYTRALKAQEPWTRIGQTYGSVLLGRATMMSVFSADPIIVQNWDTTWDEKNAYLKAGQTYLYADQQLQKRAKDTLFGDASVFTRFIVWTGIDELRLFGLISPGAPMFGVELIASGNALAGTVTATQLMVVLGAHAVQFVWWALILMGAWVLVRARRWEHPALLLIGYTALLHAPVDNIPRYNVPILLWLFALIAAALWKPIRPRHTEVTTAPRSTNAALIEGANKAYHEAEAALYDQAHPEILWCERTHWKRFGEQFLAAPDRPPVRIVDVAAGTGFIGDVLATFLRPDDRYIATDLSAEMLAQLQKKQQGNGMHIETIVCSAEALTLQDASADIVVVNSALHHFPRVERALAECARVVKPGGIVAIMHEPNNAFARSWFFRQVARVASVVAWRLDPRATDAVTKPDYTPVFAHVNTALQAQGLIQEPLPPAEIQALVDVHSPTARGGYEAVGFDHRVWSKTVFRGWKREAVETYNFLGKVDPSVRPWRRIAEAVFHRIAPSHGSLFSLVMRKPRV